MCETPQMNWKLPNIYQTSANCVRKDNSSFRDINEINPSNNIMASSWHNPKSRVIGSKYGTTKQNNINHQSASSQRTNRKKPGKNDVQVVYNLWAASLPKQNDTEVRKIRLNKRGPKPQPKSESMSRYQREILNVKQQSRAEKIDTAFAHLRDKIQTPLVTCGSSNVKLASGGKTERTWGEKMTRVNVLHTAINYIHALENILDTGNAGTNAYGTLPIQSPQPSTQADSAVVANAILKENKNHLQNGNQFNSKLQQEINKKERKPKRLNNNHRNCSKQSTNARVGNNICRPMTNGNVLNGRNININGNSVIQASPIMHQLNLHKNIQQQLSTVHPVAQCSNRVTCIISILHSQDEGKGGRTSDLHPSKLGRDNPMTEMSATYCSNWTELTCTLDGQPACSAQCQQEELSISSLAPQNVGMPSNNRALKSTLNADSSICSNVLNTAPGQVNSTFSRTPAQRCEQTENNGSSMTTNIRSNSFGLQPHARQIGCGDYLTQQNCTTKDVTELKDVSSIFQENDAAPNCSILETLLSVAATNTHPGPRIKDSQKHQPKSQGNTCVQRKTRAGVKTKIGLTNGEIAQKATTLPLVTNSPSPQSSGWQPSLHDFFVGADDPTFLSGETTENGFKTDEEVLFSTDDFWSTFDI